MSVTIHNRYDPVCPCPHCRKNREEQMAKFDAFEVQAKKRRQEEIVVEFALQAQKRRA